MSVNLNYDNCPNCFQKTNGGSLCRQCGFDIATMKMPFSSLPLFTTLNNRYLLGRTLGKGGFGITYIAKDNSNGRICAIKEYIPSEYAIRDKNNQNICPFPDTKSKYVFEHGKEKFVEEARNLIKLINNPVVVDILHYFTQNNTSYLVMEYLDGQDLRKMAKANGGTVNPEFAKTVLVTVASSLMEIHRMNILHRDLSPENIIITKNNQIKLIDFGAARNFVSNQNKGMSILLKPGFAPPEQYNTKGAQGPWSDVYALCATFYTIVSGRPLIDALFRYREKQPSLYSLGCKVTKRTSDVIEKGMELDYRRRYQDFKQLLDDIDMPNINTSQNPRRELESFRLTPAQSVPTVSSLIAGKPRGNAQIPKNDVLQIGRKQGSSLGLDSDKNISRVHCIIRYDEKRHSFYLSDAKSVNGTFLANGRRLEPNKEYEIPPGTKFYLVSKNNMMVANLK